MNEKKLLRKILVKIFNTEAKIRVLRQLNLEDSSRKKLVFRTGFSGASLSYHINGNDKGHGLVEFGLVNKEFNDTKTSYRLCLTDLGKEILSKLEMCVD